MTTLVFGHKSPDTDSTGSPILWAWYLNEIKGESAEAVLLGEPQGRFCLRGCDLDRLTYDMKGAPRMGTFVSSQNWGRDAIKHVVAFGHAIIHEGSRRIEDHSLRSVDHKRRMPTPTGAVVEHCHEGQGRRAGFAIFSRRDHLGWAVVGLNCCTCRQRSQHGCSKPDPHDTRPYTS